MLPSRLPASAVGLAALCLAIARCQDMAAPSVVRAGPLVYVSTGWTHTCGVTPAGAAFCWGGNGGALGDGTTTERLTPVAVAMPAGVTFTGMSSGGGHTCGLTPAGAAYCWGLNGDGEVGDGTKTDRLTPVAVTMPAGVTFASMSADLTHTCGLTPTGEAVCWGGNEFGQLGDGTTMGRLTPTAVAMPVGVTFTSVVVGRYHSCGLTVVGAAYCWGYNGNGQIGDGTTTDRLTATAVAMPAEVTFASLAVGDIHTCGLTAEGAAYCWGGNTLGRLGDGTTTPRLTPVAVVMPAGVTFASMSAGYANSCGLTTAGAAYCWGRNVFGELGDGTTTERLTPVAVAMPAGVTFASLAVGFVYTCGLTPAGAGYCWGVNSGGRLGDGTTTDRLIPVAVVQ